ncbi:DUF4870 family protein [Oricola cellulosilytica]|uniref:DUF4870 domain-containing protein n=1 Tax=Oricola cellulosilytica TaxID=1429082 RepID=A0A4R0PMW6_9HYPH|nr:DUF4870 domain-containing protein [Oricola cellulosilytica]TCD16619.1 hypothetical protein E0D97_04170 [Oricola cellulosilytica]
MTDPQSPAEKPAPRPTDKWLEPGPSNALVVYILYLASALIGITAVIGVVIAYINRGKAGGFVESHYTWLIRTFWIGLLYSAIAMVLAMVAVGFPLMIAVVVWAVIRMVKGMMALNRNEPIPDPLTWWI